MHHVKTAPEAKRGKAGKQHREESVGSELLLEKHAERLDARMPECSHHDSIVNGESKMRCNLIRERA